MEIQRRITGLITGNAIKQSLYNLDAVTDVLESNLSTIDDYSIDEEGGTPELQSCNNVSVPEWPVAIISEQDAVLWANLSGIPEEEHVVECSGLRRTSVIYSTSSNDFLKHKGCFLKSQCNFYFT